MVTRYFNSFLRPGASPPRCAPPHCAGRRRRQTIHVSAHISYILGACRSIFPILTGLFFHIEFVSIYRDKRPRRSYTERRVLVSALRPVQGLLKDRRPIGYRCAPRPLRTGHTISRACGSWMQEQARLNSALSQVVTMLTFRHSADGAAARRRLAAGAAPLAARVGVVKDGRGVHVHQYAMLLIASERR